jgi:hypothetical protein
MLILLGFSAKVGREEIFKSTIGNKSLHETSNDSGVNVISVLSHSKVKLSRIQHSHIAAFINTSTSPDGKIHD